MDRIRDAVSEVLDIDRKVVRQDVANRISLRIQKLRQENPANAYAISILTELRNEILDLTRAGE